MRHRNVRRCQLLFHPRRLSTLLTKSYLHMLLCTQIQDYTELLRINILNIGCAIIIDVWKQDIKPLRWKRHNKLVPSFTTRVIWSVSVLYSANWLVCLDWYVDVNAKHAIIFDLATIRKIIKIINYLNGVFPKPWQVLLGFIHSTFKLNEIVFLIYKTTTTATYKSVVKHSLWTVPDVTLKV